MHEQKVTQPSTQEDYLLRGKFLLQSALMEKMLPQLGLSELDWDARGYAAAFHVAYMAEGKEWWERFQHGEKERVLQEAQERVLDGLRASVH